MSFLDEIVVLILTCDEEANIARTLRGVAWARRIVIVDSLSVDRTRDIAAEFPQTEIHTRRFTSHAEQWNFALKVCGEDVVWVLALDADHRVTDDFVEALGGLAPSPEYSGYRAPFRYCVAGRPLRGSLYPAATVLFRRPSARFVQRGHTQRLLLSDGIVGDIKAPIDHDDRKPRVRWHAAQVRYARLEADYLRSTPTGVLRPIDRLRRLAWFTPIAVGPYALIVKRCALDGWRGWGYAAERTYVEFLIAREIMLYILHGLGRTVDAFVNQKWRNPKPGN